MSYELTGPTSFQELHANKTYLLTEATCYYDMYANVC